MASLNIRSVFIHMAQHNDERPDAFKKRYLYRMCLYPDHYLQHLCSLAQNSN